MKYLLALLLLPMFAAGKDIYQIRSLSEREILQTYTLLLRTACQHAAREWKSSSFDPATGYWGDGASGNYGGDRTSVSLVLACGILLKYDDDLRADERRDLLVKAAAAIRHVTATHVTGTQKCTDDKQWGTADKFIWGSGMQTGTLAFGAWLMWDKLDPALRQSIERVVVSEADVLARREPITGLWSDTKAEENAWEVPCLALGELMFPAHPHAAMWHETALKYLMNTLCTESDMHDTKLVDGRAVNRWVGGANLHPDFTLENHKMFHPSYVACSSYYMTQAAMYYTYAGHAVPQAATHHLVDTWRMFQTILMPWGEAAYPQGMDWELHGLPIINLFAAQATRGQDSFAARMEQQSLQYLHAWQTMCEGSLTLPGSRLGIARHAIVAEQLGYGFLAHKVFGPAVGELSASAVAAQAKGVWEYPYVGFIAHRTPKKFASFSWKNKIMGVLMPIGEGHEGNPNFTVPIPTGFVGSFELTPAGTAKTTVLENSWRKTAGGFETHGTLSLNDGRLKQTLTVTSIGEQTVVYQDRVTALSDVTVRAENGVPIGIENDAITGGTRVLSHNDGQMVVGDQESRPPVVMPGSWVNVDGRLGVARIAGAAMTYVPSSGYLPRISVRADILYGSYSDQPRTFRAGEEVANRVVVYGLEIGPTETAALAQSCRIEEQSSNRVLRFKQPDGKEATVPLL